MAKPVLIFILCFLAFNGASAQKDSLMYYFKNSGENVAIKDSADYFVVVLPPDNSVDERLFIVKGFYCDGKIRFIGKSSNNTLKLKFQGPLIAYFPNGTKKRYINYKNGEPVGDVIEYYPNGKLYNIKTNNSHKSILFKECRDSTGKILAENGNGQWIKFDESFNKV